VVRVATAVYRTQQVRSLFRQPVLIKTDQEDRQVLVVRVVPKKLEVGALASLPVGPDRGLPQSGPQDLHPRGMIGNREAPRHTSPSSVLQSPRAVTVSASCRD